MTKDEAPPTLVPTSGVRFEDQVRVVRAYVILSNNGTEPVHLKEVKGITRLARSQISGLNSYMVQLGLLEHVSRGHYKPTTAAVNLCSSAPGEEDFSQVTAVLEGSALFSLVQQYLRVHGGGSSPGLIEYIMEKAGTEETYRVQSAVEWLIRSGLVERGQD
ncbi:MAG: hypothetical protein JSW05_10450 [Candidatus Thorarchaeota archaeon]|nr:MAG: hypothetical protein JSW05_10450 [Candidatus Thorarchaeota archaeon]